MTILNDNPDKMQQKTRIPICEHQQLSNVYECGFYAVGRMNNTLEEVQFTTDESVWNATQASPSFQQLSAMKIVSTAVGLVSSVTGMCANAVVFVVLVFARRHFGSSVNTLMTNQTAMDLFTCIFLTISFTLILPGTPQHYLWLGEIGNNAVCILFRDRTLAFIFMNAEKIGQALTLKVSEFRFFVMIPKINVQCYNS